MNCFYFISFFFSNSLKWLTVIYIEDIVQKYITAHVKV